MKPWNPFPDRDRPVVILARRGDDNGDGRIDEDESGWNCKTMGNKKCGPGASSGSSSTFNKLHPHAPAGTPAGGQFVPVGKARDAKAAEAQKDAGAAANYKKAMTAKDPASVVRGLSAGDLQKLSRYAYSSKTSDKSVVRLRLAIASAMARKGLDVKKYGALGGGITAKKKATKRR